MRESRVWIWGRHPVLEAIRSNSATSVLIATGRHSSPVLTEIVKEARRQGTRVREVPLQEIERVAPGQVNQGVVAEVLERRAEDVNELLSVTGLNSANVPFLLALDQIQDPHNLGALLRTADAAGVQGVLVPERGNAKISGVVAKTSGGAVTHLPILEVTNLSRALNQVRTANIWAVGLDSSGPDLLFQTDLKIPLILVVGSEGSGIRRLVRENCDFLVRLPMLGSVQSLNASVAGSIAMYEVLRQRSNGRIK